MQRKFNDLRGQWTGEGRGHYWLCPVDGWRKAFSAKIEDWKLWQLFLVPLLAGAASSSVNRKGGVPNDLNSILWTPLPQSRDHPYRESSYQTHPTREHSIAHNERKETQTKKRLKLGAGGGVRWGSRRLFLQVLFPGTPEYHEQLRGVGFFYFALPVGSD